MVAIKICGLTQPDAVEAINQCGVDMAGFVFHKASPRHLSDDVAAQLAAQCDPKIHRIALLVDPDDAAIDTALGAISPAYLQLHGNETPARIAEIKSRTHCGIIKALHIAAIQDFAACADYADNVDLFLFDSKPAIGHLAGGRGVSFDWKLIKAYDKSRPYLLAGGLSPDNVREALKQSQASMVDISSGVESAPGVKDPDLITAFVDKVRSI